MSRYFILSILLFNSFIGTSQSHLYLKKLTGKLAIKYEVGNQIRFQLRGDNHFTIGMIESFGEDHFIIHETEVQLTDIYRYDIRGLHNHNFNYKASSNTLIYAGGLLPLAELLNQQVSGSGNNTGIHNSIWTASGSLVLGGLLVKLLEPKYFKPDWKRKATIIQK